MGGTNHILPVMIKMSSYLSPRRLAVLDADSKPAALRQLLQTFAGCPQIIDHARFSGEIFAREEMLPTNLSGGIGVPHARSAAVREPVAALGVLTRPIVYGGLSPQPVSAIIIVGMPENANDEYLRYLARISYVFSKDEIRQRIFACRTPEELCRLVCQY